MVVLAAPAGLSGQQTALFLLPCWPSPAGGLYQHEPRPQQQEQRLGWDVHSTDMAAEARHGACMAWGECCCLWYALLCRAAESCPQVTAAVLASFAIMLPVELLLMLIQAWLPLTISLCSKMRVAGHHGRRSSPASSTNPVSATSPSGMLLSSSTPAAAATSTPSACNSCSSCCSRLASTCAAAMRSDTFTAWPSCRT